MGSIYTSSGGGETLVRRDSRAPACHPAACCARPRAPSEAHVEPQRARASPVSASLPSPGEGVLLRVRVGKLHSLLLLP
eukprot:CAMPEP_0182904624 /NCGR_PEP_ID=MMETSP0034_2-20130328/32256_1 /TAXON_ID=156128 /ORGANISM="Nephroselmis pyriformis, Strain CCMP717" /LENGTH=78 /DNA_ID=CAMNT_0025039813 /DNA_START=18 /DNA_END=251 /DNA_ORIENTATION=-